MRVLIVPEKTGFQITNRNKPVIIRDSRGIIFYDTEPILSRRPEHFNLPGFGKFFVETGEFRQLPSPVDYKLLNLPPKERDMGSPFEFKITFGHNPKKCTIDFKTRTIFFDNAFQEKPLPELYFVLYHEYAHQYFKTERYTDALATNYMLKKGFNPYQIGRAHVLSLSSYQHYRKKYNLEKILESNGLRG